MVGTPTGDPHVQEGRDAARLAYLSDAGGISVPRL